LNVAYLTIVGWVEAKGTQQQASIYVGFRSFTQPTCNKLLVYGINMKKVLIAAGCVVFSVMSSSKTMAADLKFDQLFSFGDSLSDTGNLFTRTGGLFPVRTVNNSTQPAYSPGRFSNGDIWVDYFSKQIGQQTPTPVASLNPTTIPAGGVNFAFGGAQTGESNSPPNFPE
jgi:phospholipase/lecithinase/hemolysin